MIFDRPGLILYSLVSATGPMAGLSLSRYYGGGWDTSLMMLGILSFTGLTLSTFLAHDYDEYKRLVADDNKPHLKMTEPVKPKNTLLDINTGQPVYNFQTAQVRIDPMRRKIKHFCIVLVNQRDNGFKIDLREATWNAHFGGRDNFVQVRDVRLAGAFAKEGSRVNSPFVVVDWRKVEEGARGGL